MKRVRLDPTQERRLSEAAARQGVTKSEFMRRAVDKACDEVLDQETLYDKIKNLIGSVEGPGDDASRRAKAVFGQMVEAKHARILAEREQLANSRRVRSG